MATRARGRGRAFGLDRGVRFFTGAAPYPSRRENGMIVKYISIEIKPLF